MYCPNGTNGMFLVSCSGKGFPPGTPRHGSSNPPAGESIVVAEAQGGCDVCDPNRYSVPYSSNATPYDARTEVRPLPCTSHAKPTRGANSFQYVFQISALGSC